MAINIRNYQKINGGRTIHCGICHIAGHNRRHCPNVEEWAKEWEEAFENETTHNLDQRWSKRQAYVEKMHRKGGVTVRNKPRCGFCRALDHNRRNCTVLSNLRTKLVKANEAWRRQYAKFATVSGCSPATLLEVTHQEYDYNVHKYVVNTDVVLVAKVLPENLTLFCAASDWDIKQECRVPLVGNQRLTELPATWFGVMENNIDAVKLFGRARYGYNTDSTKVKVVKESAYRFTEEWIKQVPEDIDFVLKKMTLERLQRFKLEEIADGFLK